MAAVLFGPLPIRGVGEAASAPAVKILGTLSVVMVWALGLLFGLALCVQLCGCGDGSDPEPMRTLRPASGAESPMPPAPTLLPLPAETQAAERLRGGTP